MADPAPAAGTAPAADAAPAGGTAPRLARPPAVMIMEIRSWAGHIFMIIKHLPLAGGAHTGDTFAYVN